MAFFLRQKKKKYCFQKIVFTYDFLPDKEKKSYKLNTTPIWKV